MRKSLFTLPAFPCLCVATGSDIAANLMTGALIVKLQVGTMCISPNRKICTLQHPRQRQLKLLYMRVEFRAFRS